MALESFYGGRPGITPVIKGQFSTIEEMNNAFKQGDEYTKIWYNELCLIDPKNKNSADNGKLFRRTLKGAGDTGDAKCATYLGRIVGTSGANPALIITNPKAFEGIINNGPILGDGARIVYPSDSGGTSITESSILPSINSLPWISASTDENNQMLVPGKTETDGQIAYNDDIQYTWINVMSDNAEDAFAGRIYMGFQIPYLVNEFKTHQLNWTTVPTIGEEDESKDHPFYNLWNIGLPQGIRGNAASGLRTAYPKDFINTAFDVSTAGQDQYLYDFATVFSSTTTDGVSTFNIPDPTTGTEAEWNNVTPVVLRDKQESAQNEPILVYDYTIYNKPDNTTNASKQTLTFFLGFYKQIKSINMDESGKIYVHYGDAQQGETVVELTEENKESGKNALTWITSIEVNDTGYLTITTNNHKAELKKQLPYPKTMSVDDYGKVKVDFYDNTSLILKDSDAPTAADFYFNFINDIVLDNDTKVLSGQYSTRQSDKIFNSGIGLNYISAVALDNYNHLLVFLASSQYRPASEDDADADTIPELLKDGGYRIQWHGYNYRNGWNYSNTLTDSTLEINIDVSDYWLDLGLVYDAEQGLRLWTSAQYTRHPEKESIPTYTPAQFIERVLSPEWWDSNETIKNPYYGGYMGYYETEESTEITRFANQHGEPYWGGILAAPDISSGSAFFYDYGIAEWKWLGDWGESSFLDAKIGADGESGIPNLSTYGVRFLPRTYPDLDGDGQPDQPTSVLPDFSWTEGGA